jgi:parallel beta-helix repeat protein
VIKFQATSDDVFSLIDSCLINYSSEGVTFTDAGSTLSNTTIFKSYNFGIRCENSSTPLVNNVTFNGCRLDPIAMSLQSNPTLTNITFSANGSKGIRILDNTLSSNATLSQRNVAGITNIAYIMDYLTINSGAVFTVLPGVVIKFTTYYYGITVNGALVANGTPTQKIIFTALADDSNGGDTNNDGNGSSPSKGNWNSIDFGASSSDTLNSLRNCEFRYGGGYNYSNDYGIVRVFSTTIKMDSCIVAQSYSSGVGVFGSGHPTVSNVQINNVGLTPVTISMFANPTFSNITALNVGYMAIGIKPETYSITNTIPIRNFAGYNNITYLLYGTITVNSGTTITIPAGVVFKDGNWVVNGALTMNGTPSQKVVFTDSRDDSYGNPGDTNLDGTTSKPAIVGGSRITFYDVSLDSLSLLKHAIFRYSDGGVYLQQASPKLLNCTFDSDNFGVYLTGVSNPSIDSCSFNNLTYTPMRLSLVSYPVSTNGNTISGTTYKAIGVLEGETLVQDVTLTKKFFAGYNNIPFLFGNYYVANNSVLTISPGMILKFFPTTGMTIRKGLIAEGSSTSDSTIVFTDLRDDFYGNDTNSDSSLTSPATYGGYYYYPGWYGLTFTNETLSPFCKIRNAVIRYAGLTNSGAAITLNTASPTITFTALTNNYDAIVATGASNPVINYSDIYQNTRWGINNVNQAFNINAENNWWGTSNGPTHSGNLGGTGQSVSNQVDYSPFLGSGALNPLAGDVSLNGAIQAYDASLILKWLADSVANQLNTLQKKVADVSGVGGITAMDASLVLQYVVGKIGIFPMQPPTFPGGEFPKKDIAVGFLSLTSSTVNRGQQVTVAVTAEGLAKTYGAGIELSFDKDVLKAISVQTEALASGKMMEYAMGEGKLRIFLASADAMEGSGNLLTITFEAKKDVRGQIQSPIRFTELSLNESNALSQTREGAIEVKGMPLSFDLLQNYPNPFNPSTTVTFNVPNDGEKVRLEIYNVTGQLVRVLADKEYIAGQHQATWDGTGERGERFGSGIYFLRMKTGTFVSVKKMIMVK